MPGYMDRPRLLSAGGLGRLLAVFALAQPAAGVIVTPNTPPNSVTVHKLTAGRDAAPQATVAGAATGLNQPFGVFTEPNQSGG